MVDTTGIQLPGAANDEPNQMAASHGARAELDERALSELCQACGACCATSAEWPRFSTEDDASLDLIPLILVDPGLGRMRCTGDRCAALAGEVGERASCTIYAIRPDVCRACLPGDDACTIARAKWQLTPLSS